MPELAFDSLDKVPEELREHAVEQDEKVLINVVPKTKLDEFRENNINIAKERDELNQKYSKVQEVVGEDLDEFQKQYNDLLETKRLVEAGELVKNTSLDEAVQKRTAEMKSDLEGKIKSLEQDRNAWKEQTHSLQNRYNQREIDRYVTEAVLDPELGARPEALPDILRRAHDAFTVKDDGSIIPMENDQVVYGSDGTSPMTNKEWLLKMKKEAPHFFKGSSGGDAGGGGGSVPGGSSKLSAEQISKLSMDEYKEARKAGRI